MEAIHQLILESKRVLAMWKGQHAHKGLQERLEKVIDAAEREYQSLLDDGK